MAYPKSSALITIVVFGLLMVNAGWAAVSKAEAKKYPPIAGEVYGQVPPGVKSIQINGKGVAIDPHQKFRSFVSLKAGEKYLTLKINYEGLRIIKKYLIVRKPQIKQFKVFVPKEKMKAPPQLEKKQKARAQKRAKQLVKVKKRRQLTLATKPRTASHPSTKQFANYPVAQPINNQSVKLPPKPKPDGYQYVWEFSRGKLMLVKTIKSRYSADIFIPETEEWFALDTLSKEALQAVIEKPLTKTKEAVKDKRK